MSQPTQNLVGVLLENEDGSFNSKYPSGNKPVKRYIEIFGSDFGAAPTKVIYKDWRYETVGQRATKEDWTSALYGATGVEAYPLFGSVGGVTGISSRDNLNIDYSVDVADSQDYKMTISGTQYVINSGVGATSTSIVTALKSAINADSGCPAVASGTTYLSLSRKTPSVPFSVWPLEVVSTTSLLIGTGSKTLTLAVMNASYTVGQIVNIISTAFVGDYMTGTITAFNSSTGVMTVNVTSINGSGTKSSWTVTAVDTYNLDLMNNGLTGFVKEFDPDGSFFVAWQAGTPDTHYFSGAVNIREFAPISTQKMGWFSDEPLDSAKKADIVSLSRVSAVSWYVSGNQTNVGLYPSNAWSWNQPNSVYTYHKAGASPFVDNGKVRCGIATAAGCNVSSVTNTPLFRKLSTLTITAQNSTNYIVTINGTPCTTFTSSGSATVSEIKNGLISAISGSTSAVVASGLGNNVVCTAVNGTNPTVTATANILVENSNPWFDQVSTIWSGNGNQANSVTIYPTFAAWTGPNCGNQIALADSATFSASTKFIVLDAEIFQDDHIRAPYYDLQAVGMTHWIRFKDGLVVDSGAL